MLFKDVSEVHNLAVSLLGKPELFDRVVKGSIEAALKRHRASSLSSSPIGRDVGDEGGLRVINAREFPRDVPPQEYVVDSLIPVGHVTTLYGSGGSTKSILAMSLAMAASRGDASWLGLGMSGKSFKSIYVDFELLLRDQVRRSRQLSEGAGHNGDLPDNFNYLAAGGRPPSEVFGYLFDYCKDHRVQMLVIDSVGMAMSGDASAYRDVVSFFRELDRFRIELGCTIILIDHQANLSAGENYQSKAAFGSSYKGNLTRSRVQVEPREQAQNKRRIVLRHNKANFTNYVDPFEVEVTFSDEKIELTPQKMSEADLMQEQQLPAWKRGLIHIYDDRTPKGKDDMAEVLGVTPGTASNVLSELRKEGYAEYHGEASGNQPRQVVITKTGIDYVETFLAEYRGKSKKDKDGGDEGDDDGPPAASSSSLPPIEDDGDDRTVKVTVPLTSASALQKIIEALDGVEKVALDLETMPPDGWVFEVAAAYRLWRKGLKGKPTPDRKRAKWDDLKEKTYRKYAVDIETARVRLVSLATHEGLNEVIDAAKVDVVPLLDALKDKTLITHNGAFDLGILRERYGYVHDGKVLDTQLLYVLHHYAEAGDRSQISGGKWRVPDPMTTRIDLYGTGKKTVGMSALGAVVKKYLGVALDKSDQASDWSVPDLTADQVSYALMDTRVLLDLSTALIQKLEGLGMGQVVDLESRAFAAQIAMQLNGFPADIETAKAMAERYRVEGQDALEELNALLPDDKAPGGGAWNWSRSEDIRAVLRLLGASQIDHEDYPRTENTAQPSTSASALATIEQPEPAARWVRAYLKYLGIHKRYRDFASKYAGLIKDGRMRGRFATISTGRLNCQKPNLQQVPKRGHLQTQEGMRIRDIFRPAPGDVFIVADFAQVELLLAATIAQRETGMEGHMLRVFEDAKIDIHTETAASMLKKPVEDVFKDERTLAKAVNFGLIYGAKAETLLEYARDSYGIKDMSLSDATRYRTAFFERYPELLAWHELVEKRCLKGRGYSTTPLGRRRKLPKWASSGSIASTTAKNSPVQGAGADAIKLTLARLFEDRHNCPGNPRLNCCIHDEVVLSVAEEHKEAAVSWVEEHMAAAERAAIVDPKSPIVVDVEAKYSWGG